MIQTGSKMVSEAQSIRPPSPRTLGRTEAVYSIKEACYSIFAVLAVRQDAPEDAQKSKNLLYLVSLREFRVVLYL